MKAGCSDRRLRKYVSISYLLTPATTVKPTINMLAKFTIIPAKHGRPSQKPFKGKYCRLMQQEFDGEIYGQRWQVETVFSMIKRNQGDALRSRTDCSQNREIMLKVLTHNIAIISLVNELFYRACPVHFLIHFPSSAILKSVRLVHQRRKFH